MTSSAIPAVMDALLALWGALDGVDAVEGPGWDSGDPRQRAVYVGLSDPDSEDPDTAATSDQEWANLGHAQRAETWRVACVAACWDGDAGEATAVRRGVFDLLEQLAAVLHDSPNLDIPEVTYVSGFESVDLRLGLTEPAGVLAYLPFYVAGRARLES